MRLFRTAPQVVTRRGIETAVLALIEEWSRLQRAARPSLKALLLAPEAGIECTRRQDPSKVSDIEAWADPLDASYQILAMDTKCFREWGRIVGRKPDELLEDAMIAATARVHHLMVGTRNKADFKRLDVQIFNPFEHR